MVVEQFAILKKFRDLQGAPLAACQVWGLGVPTTLIRRLGRMHPGNLKFLALSILDSPAYIRSGANDHGHTRIPIAGEDVLIFPLVYLTKLLRLEARFNKQPH